MDFPLFSKSQSYPQITPHSELQQAYFPSSDEHETDSGPPPSSTRRRVPFQFPIPRNDSISPNRPGGRAKRHNASADHTTMWTPQNASANAPHCNASYLLYIATNPTPASRSSPDSLKTATLQRSTACLPRDYCCLRTHAARTQVPDTRVLLPCSKATDDSKAKRQKQTVASKQQHSHCATFRVLPPHTRQISLTRSRGRERSHTQRGVQSSRPFAFLFSATSPAPSLFF